MKKIILIIFIVIILVTFLTWINTIVWTWVVPDVFAGMVAAGLLPATITFSQSLKLTALSSAFLGFGRFNRSKD